MHLSFGDKYPLGKAAVLSRAVYERGRREEVVPGGDGEGDGQGTEEDVEGVALEPVASPATERPPPVD